jgi:hypothetical protein
MRVKGWQVVPVVLADDDETGEIEDAPVQPVFIPRALWDAFKAGGDDEALETIRRQIEN